MPGFGAAALAAAAALTATGPRFATHGRASDAALLGDAAASMATAIAEEVGRRGFYAGEALGASDCAECHRDVAAQWSASAHRFSSFNNPYYRVSVEDFRREKGAGASRFCGGCHEPALTASGALLRAGDVDRAAPAAQAGVTCLTCHSITAVDREGNGRYTADLAPVPLGPGPHGARLRPALMAEAGFCAACHKVGLGSELTGGHWLRGQNDYDAWHASGVAGNGAASIHRPPGGEVKRCQDCHMPLEPATLGDRAAKNGVIRSHRFLGANTALPHLRGDAEQEARTAAFLRGRASLALLPSGERRFDALMRARGVGHRFPAGTMDSNEVWLEVTALDGAGRVLGVSGARERDGSLAKGTHLVRVQPVDGAGKPLLRRDPQHMRGVAYDGALTPSDPQVVRFEAPPGTARVKARLLYRKFTAAYARYACADFGGAGGAGGVGEADGGDLRRRCLDLPIVEIAAAEVAAGATVPDDFALLTDWGLALGQATADHADEARAPLERARALEPGRVEPLLGLARLALLHGRTDEVVKLADEARRIAPEHPAPSTLAAQALLAAYRAPAALAAAERLALRLPGDRTSLVLLARARGLTGDATGALAAADRVLAIDPESEDGHYHRALALAELGRHDEAALALGRYERYRATVETDLLLRNRWRADNAGEADEPEPCHTHRIGSAGPAAETMTR